MRKETAKRITIKCSSCGKEFEVRESRKNTKFCSNECKYSVVNKKEDIFKVTKRQLLSMYHNHKMSLSDIAKELGCTKTTVRRKFKKFEIETRTPGQGKSIFLKSNPDQNPNNLPGVKEKQREAQVRFCKNNPDILEDRNNNIKEKWTDPKIRENHSKMMIEVQFNKTLEQKYHSMKKQMDTKRKNGTLNCSGLEDKYSKQLDDKNVEYIREYILPEGTRRYRYDFYIPESNTLIEIQGNGTHANPDKYNPEDVVKLGLKNWKVKTASEIWKYDEEKKEYAVKNGYNVEYVWENELL